MEQSPSLVVKLSHHCCEKCTDILSRWGEPASLNSDATSQFTSKWGDQIYEQDLINTSNHPQWAWRCYSLRNSAQFCGCCRFILQSLIASPWMFYQDDDLAVLKLELVGTTYRPSLQRQIHTPSARQQHNPKYQRFQRPRLQIFKNQRNGEPKFYEADSFTHILPLARSYHDDRNETLGAHEGRTFYGRVVNADVDINLLRDWFNICRTKHVKHNKHPGQSPIKGAKPANIASEDCCPLPRSRTPHFRLIDVTKRCVVLACGDEEYAALSYVWGHATRIVLRNENLVQLSAPEALSQVSMNLPRTFLDALSIAEQLGIHYLWIDALCIIQDNAEEMVEQMNSMGAVYGSAVLTIVSDTDSADTGIPGVGIPRGPPQATFAYNGDQFTSSKKTFGQALRESPWEKRAWCLQEKLFSRRLLIFTTAQTFFHCLCSTWFEDTVLDTGEDCNEIVTLVEGHRPNLKGHRIRTYTPYRPHQPIGPNFWKVVQEYSRRQLSFESDAIRAFSGILESVEHHHGHAIWGIPRDKFESGITFYFSQNNMNLRRHEFPSWTWAAWRGNAGSELLFNNISKSYDSIWNIDWHYYCLDGTGKHTLTPVKPAETLYPAGVSDIASSSLITEVSMDQAPPNPFVRPKAFAESTSLLDKGALEPRILVENEGWTHTQLEGTPCTLSQPDMDWNASYKMDHTWGLPSHPGESQASVLAFDPLNHDPDTMPPLSHILRFWTSSALLHIDAKPRPQRCTNYNIRNPHTGEVMNNISLDPNWKGLGRLGEFIYISEGFLPAEGEMSTDDPTMLNLMLIEWDDRAVVAQRVTMCEEPMSIHDWRLAEPVWKCIALA